MTAYNLTITYLENGDGDPIEGARVTAGLNKVDYFPEGTVTTSPVVGTTDVNGQLVLSLHANATGTQDSRYIVHIKDPNTGSTSIRTIQMPAGNATLSGLVDAATVETPSQSDINATAAALSSGTATTKAAEAAASAAAALVSEQASTTSASEAAASAASISDAAAQAAIATTKAGEAAASAVVAADAETGAVAAKDAAESAEAGVAADAATATTAAGNAATSESNSSANSNYSEEWANKAEDSLVSVAAGGDGATEYSAKHHALKSVASKDAAATSETNAGNSATAASSSEDAAETARVAAELAETNASASMVAAGSSETNAGASETAAAGSASTASTHNTNAQAAKTAAEAAQVIAVSAKNDAETAEGNTLTSEANAGNSATGASGSASTATTQAGIATGASSAASNAQGYAEEWANKAEDVLITVAAGGDGSTEFSAKHWATKAEASASEAASTTLPGLDDVVLTAVADEEVLTYDSGTGKWVNGAVTGYTHPANHPPSIITQDATNRFVTDTEKSTWNAKADTAGDVGLGSVDNTSDADKPVSTAQQTALDLKANSSQVLTDVPGGALFTDTDTVYTHPANHAPSIITQDATNRFVTDAEKSTWNGKADTDTNTQLSDSQVETAYNNQVSAASTVEMQAGVVTSIRRMAPKDVLDAIVANAAASGALEDDAHNTNYTFVVGDELNKMHNFTSATPATYTIPLNATAAFDMWSVLPIHNTGTADLGVTATGAATLSLDGSDADSDFYVLPGETVVLLKVGTDAWKISGGSTDANGGGSMTVNAHNGAYTFAPGDEENVLHTFDSTANTWTIPLNATVAFAAGSVLTLHNKGTADLTITAAGAATLRISGSTVDDDLFLRADETATIIQVGADDWVMAGGSYEPTPLPTPTGKMMFMGAIF